MKKLLALTMTAALMVSLIAVAPVSAASKKPAVKSYTLMYYDSDAKKWDKFDRTVVAYDYDKVNPVLVEYKYYSSENVNETKFKYKYSGKKAKTRKTITEIGRVSTKASYKGGRIVKTVYTSADKKSKQTNAYKYGKGGYVKSRTYNYVYKSSSGKSKDTAKYNYKVTLKKGLPTQIVGSRKGDNYTKNITKYKGGIVSEKYAEYDGNKTDYTTIYKTKKKGGKVAQVIVYEKYSSGKKTPVRKYTFKYTNKVKMNAQRYASMINSTIMSDDYYAVFPWF